MNKKVTPFTFLDAVGFSKNTNFEEGDWKEYVPFIINRGLSYHMDSLFFSNEINKYADLPKDMQFQFYLSSLRSKRRFAKWAKKTDSEDLKLVQNALQCNVRRALEALELLSPSDIMKMREEQDKGGVQGGKRK